MYSFYSAVGYSYCSSYRSPILNPMEVLQHTVIVTIAYEKSYCTQTPHIIVELIKWLR